MYLSILIQSRKGIQGNNHTRTYTNTLELQKLGDRTVITAECIKFALRAKMADTLELAREIATTTDVNERARLCAQDDITDADAVAFAADDLWRKYDPNNKEKTPNGLIYRDSSGVFQKNMAKAVPAFPEAFCDSHLFGYMIAVKGKEEKDGASSEIEKSEPLSEEDDADATLVPVVEAPKKKAKNSKPGQPPTPKAKGTCDSYRSPVNLSLARSCEPFNASQSMIFNQGHKPEGENLNPFEAERHETAYQYTVTINLSSLKNHPHRVHLLLRTLLSGIRPGGRQSQNDYVLQPESFVWRIYREQGNSGLATADSMEEVIASLENDGYSWQGTPKGLTLHAARAAIRADVDAAFNRLK